MEWTNILYVHCLPYVRNSRVALWFMWGLFRLTPIMSGQWRTWLGLLLFVIIVVRLGLLLFIVFHLQIPSWCSVLCLQLWWFTLVFWFFCSCSLRWNIRCTFCIVHWLAGVGIAGLINQAIKCKTLGDVVVKTNIWRGFTIKSWKDQYSWRPLSTAAPGAVVGNCRYQEHIKGRSIHLGCIQKLLDEVP